MSTKSTLVYPQVPESFHYQPSEKLSRNYFFSSIPVRADGKLDFGCKPVKTQGKNREWKAEEVPDG